MISQRYFIWWVIAFVLLVSLACTKSGEATPSGVAPTLAEMPAAPSAEIPDAAPTAWRMVVCADGLNVRAAPDPSALKVGGLVRGDVVQVLEWQGDWVRVRAGQWVNGGYLCKE